MNQLQAKHLQKRYKTRKVVKDISIGLKSGEIVGLLGPNGAGKTTAFYMMIGLVDPTQGEVFFNKKNITKLPMHERARMGVGYLPQEASVFRKLSVSDNILAILELQKNLTLESRQARLEQLLNEFHIGHIRNNIGVSLSGGERRRVEIARALAIEPKFILLDEPFAGIDPISVVDIKHLIRHLSAKGIGILITDHNVRETLDICERAYIVNDGEILCEGNAEAILQNPRVRDVYLGEDFEL
jgi:lipopolysaccharide export system ATP-binding protein